MKNQMFRLVGRLTVVLIITMMFVFAGLLVITPNNNDVQASWHDTHHSYPGCSVCGEHDHKVIYFDPRDM